MVDVGVSVPPPPWAFSWEFFTSPSEMCGGFNPKAWVVSVKARCNTYVYWYSLLVNCYTYVFPTPHLCLFFLNLSAEPVIAPSDGLSLWSWLLCLVFKSVDRPVIYLEIYRPHHSEGEWTQ